MANGDELPPIPPPSAGVQPPPEGRGPWTDEARPPDEPPSATEIGGLSGGLEMIGSSFVRGVQLGQPIGKGGGLTPENVARAKQGETDPALRARGYLNPQEYQAEQARRARIQQDQAADVRRGGWLSSIPETIGEFVGDPRMYLGNAASKAAAPIAGLAAREVGGAVGQRIAGSAAGTTARDFMRAPETLREARKSDVVAQRYGQGTRGMREGVSFPRTTQTVEKISAALPGGGRIVKAATEMQSERAQVVDQIVHNLTRGRQVVTGGSDYAMERMFQRWGRMLMPHERAMVRGVVPDVTKGVGNLTRQRELGLTRLFGYIKESYDQPLVAMQVLEPLTRYMGPGDRQLLAGYMLDRMGTTALDGARTPFTVENFLRNWDGMHASVRDHLFGWEGLGGEGIGTGYARNIQTIVDSLKRMEPYSDMAARAKVGYGDAGGYFQGRKALRWTEGAGLVWGFYQYALHQNPGLLKGILAAHGANAMVALALTNPDTTAVVARQMVRYAAQVKAHYQHFGDDTQFLDELNRVPQ